MKKKEKNQIIAHVAHCCKHVDTCIAKEIGACNFFSVADVIDYYDNNFAFEGKYIHSSYCMQSENENFLICLKQKLRMFMQTTLYMCIQISDMYSAGSEHIYSDLNLLHI